MTFEELEKICGIVEDKTNLMLTNLFPVGTSIVYGANSSGKTISTLKHLKRNNIKPIFIDFDNNHHIDRDSCYAINGYKFIDGIKNNDEIVRDTVYIIDDYALCFKYLDNNLSIFKRLIKTIKEDNNSSVIIMSHETGERGAYSELDSVFHNHADGRFHLKRDITKTKGIENYLIVDKSRAYKGEAIIKDWERN